MMVDMATPYDEFVKEDSQFAQMRDSLYILSVMNQCKFTWHPKISSILIEYCLQIWFGGTYSKRKKI